MRLITVIMPAYNAAPYICEAINSILNQTHGEIELLICDDCSTDQTYSLICGIDDPRIRVSQNVVNRGYLLTSNDLVSLAGGEFITFQDADDYSSPNRIETLLRELENSSLDMVGSNVDHVNDYGALLYRTEFPAASADITRGIDKGQVPFCGAAILFRKSMLGGLALYDERFNRIGSEDVDWVYRTSLTFSVGNVPESLYFYRMNVSGVSKSTDIQQPLKFYSQDLAYDLYKCRKNQSSEDRCANVFAVGRERYLRHYSQNNERYYAQRIYNAAIANRKAWLIRLLTQVVSERHLPLPSKIFLLGRGTLFVVLGYKRLRGIKTFLGRRVR